MSTLFIPLLCSLFFSTGSSQIVQSCSSKIYCQGTLLDTVQMARLYPDSKTFVDFKLKNKVQVTLEHFEKFNNATNNNPNKSELQEFVDEHFEPFDGFEPWTPVDFNKDPQILSQIKDVNVRNFTKSLHNIWPLLARKVKAEVFANPEQYSLIPVRNGFVVPGGRFQEFYYWDSYFIMKGLLISGMTETVRGMIENFLEMVETYGFIPNGARVYYLNRSQPPLLTSMVVDYIEATNNTQWLQKVLPTLAKELQFWLKNRLVVVEKGGVRYTVAHYSSDSGTPRPESYFEDVTLSKSFQTPQQRQEVFADLKGAAESGVDFSSRWIVNSTGGTNASLEFIKTRRIIPVDLNAYLCKSFRKLGDFYMEFNDYTNAKYWYQLASLWQEVLQKVFYHDVDGIWYDWDTTFNTPRRYFFPTNFSPLWAQAHDPKDALFLGRKAASYLKYQKVPDFQGGIPSSLSETGQQWDLPNAWPPHQSILIMGLVRSGDYSANVLAEQFAKDWIKANMIGWNEHQAMYEKYNALKPGSQGQGGEYVSQSGFGWTNGVVLEFIKQYYT